jgi:hypothetical protein
MNLAEDQYANYLIQFLLEKWNNTPEGNEIKKKVRTNFEKLCEKKYSSFICELYIKIISPEEMNELFESLDVNRIRLSNNHHSMKILKLLGFNNNNNHKFNNQVPKNRNNNYNNNNNNNISFNNQNNMNSRFFGMNNNSNGNNIINNFNNSFNNNCSYGGF